MPKPLVLKHWKQILALLQVSLHFNGCIPVGLVLASTRMTPFCILLELRMMQLWMMVVVTTGAMTNCYMLNWLQSNCYIAILCQPESASSAATPSQQVRSSVILRCSSDGLELVSRHTLGPNVEHWQFQTCRGCPGLKTCLFAVQWFT